MLPQLCVSYCWAKN